MPRKPIWTPQKIKKGFNQFINENGRLPKATEIDKLSYLPSSRMIQKRFGGLEKLRQELGFNVTHFGKGKHRSQIAKVVGRRGRQLEIDLEKELQNKYGELHVHTEKTFYGKQRVDFYIYCDRGNFGIDIFYPNTLATLQSNVNIKMKKYQNFTLPLYLVMANPSFTQKQLDDYTHNKKNTLPENVKLITLSVLAQKLGIKTDHISVTS